MNPINREGPRVGANRHAVETPPRILLAEVGRETRALLGQALRRSGYDVAECPDGVCLLDHVAGEAEEIALIISDIRMPGVTGLEIREGLHDREVSPPMILLAAFGDEEIHAQAQRLGAAAVFDEPFDLDALLGKVREMVPLSLKWTRSAVNRGDS